jgi:1-phosphofructokinase family hexose kinase
LVFDSLALGEVNRACESAWCASGKVLNVGLSLAHLQTPCMTIAPLGGLAREEIDREFTACNAPACWIESASPTRVCTTILDRSIRKTTELIENAGSISAAELAVFIAAYAEAAANASLVVLAGSLPSGAPATLYQELLVRTPCPAILDVRGPELLAALECRPLLVKPNRAELARTIGRRLADDADLLCAMRKLNAAGAQWAMVTNGKRTIWLTSLSASYRLLPLPVDFVCNPIGCGDALAAGMAWALARGADIPFAARMGVAAAADRLRELRPGRLDGRRIHAQVQDVVLEAC